MITRIPWVKVVLNNIWNPADQKSELFFQQQQDKDNDHDNDIENNKCIQIKRRFPMQYTHCVQGYQFSDFVTLLIKHGIDNIDMPERERDWTVIPPVLFVCLFVLTSGYWCRHCYKDCSRAHIIPN